MLKELCQINSIPEGGSRSFEHFHSALFAIKKGEQIFLYLNRCPHMFVPLNWEPNKFLNNSRVKIYREYSQNACELFVDNYFDFIYNRRAS